jgi:hypothetical protein
MRRIVVCAVLLAGLLVPAAAPATTLETDGGATRPQPFQSWVDRAAVPTPPGLVRLSLAACPGGPAWGAACASPADRAIHLGSEGRDPVTLLHELGHLFDELVLDDTDRAAFQALLGRRGPWFGPAASDPPNERFAEAYALCARYPRLRATRLGMYAYIATPRRHARVCRLVRAVAARHAVR